MWKGEVSNGGPLKHSPSNAVKVGEHEWLHMTTHDYNEHTWQVDTKISQRFTETQLRNQHLIAYFFFPRFLNLKKIS